jgi:hypothetical protein
MLDLLFWISVTTFFLAANGSVREAVKLWNAQKLLRLSKGAYGVPLWNAILHFGMGTFFSALVITSLVSRLFPELPTLYSRLTLIPGILIMFISLVIRVPEWLGYRPQ